MGPGKELSLRLLTPDSRELSYVMSHKPLDVSTYRLWFSKHDVTATCLTFIIGHPPSLHNKYALVSYLVIAELHVVPRLGIYSLSVQPRYGTGYYRHASAARPRAMHIIDAVGSSDGLLAIVAAYLYLPFTANKKR
jgi:hypothetical protein